MRFASIAVALGIVSFVSCRSSTPTPHVAAMQCTGGNLDANVVTSVCGGAVSSTVQTISVSLGPTAETDIHGFHFDLLYDTTHVAYVDASAVAGSLLTQGGSTPALSVTFAGGAPGHLVIDIHRDASEPGVAWNADFNHVVSMRFAVTPVPAFGPSPISFQNTSAFGSTGGAIAGLIFRDGVRLSYE